MEIVDVMSILVRPYIGISVGFRASSKAAFRLDLLKWHDYIPSQCNNEKPSELAQRELAQRERGKRSDRVEANCRLRILASDRASNADRRDQSEET